MYKLTLHNNFPFLMKKIEIEFKWKMKSTRNVRILSNQNTNTTRRKLKKDREEYYGTHFLDSPNSLARGGSVINLLPMISKEYINVTHF